jgi:mRNA-degrading endonuclease RelE of RelBE toxin-antitoxin system
VRIEWSPVARASARGDYHRLRVGRFRVVYVIDGDLITVERVDRAT